MDLLKDFMEQNWDKFLAYLKLMGIPEDECENYANDLLRQLKG